MLRHLVAPPYPPACRSKSLASGPFSVGPDDREQAVVQLVADGLSNREIATHLKLSQHTVKNYLFRVFDKIGVSNRVELVLCALTSPMADPTLAPHTDQEHAVTIAVRRRPDSMTNA
jgi:DNA-binding CsgD family transcriptional regulator